MCITQIGTDRLPEVISSRALVAPAGTTALIAVTTAAIMNVMGTSAVKLATHVACDIDVILTMAATIKNKSVRWHKTPSICLWLV